MRTIRRFYAARAVSAVVAGLGVILGCGAVGAQMADVAEGMWARASLYRDEWGTPHVYADDFQALGFAFGYAQAEDHLESMLLAYRVANGRAAEVMGEPYAQSDEFALKMRHTALARAAYGSLDPLTRDLCEGFAVGVNAWLVEHPDRAPGWADGVKPEDPLALLHCYLTSMAPFDLPETYHPAPGALSGNAWAVGPSRSESGEPLLAINPHVAYDSPFQWYEAHLVCQDMNVAGATLFGLPAILQGHNDTLGWALTPNNPDFADMYIEPSPAGRRAPRNINAPPTPGDERMLQMALLSESQPYYVKTENGMSERSVPCASASRGPIMGMFKGRMVAYCVGGYGDFGAIAQLAAMARAPNLDAFQAALAMQQLPCFHVVYADRDGNIFYLYNVKTGNKPVAEQPRPTRKKIPEDDPDAEGPPPKVIDWNTPVPADNPVFTWRDVIPVESLPSLANPASGYVQACGSPPWAATEPSAITPEGFPTWFAHDRDTFRAQRVRRLLGMGKRSARDCQSMLYDVVVPVATEAVPRLLDAAAQRADFVTSAHPDLGVGLDTLKAWNFTADAKSGGMTFFEVWWSALQRQNPDVFQVFSPVKENLAASQEAMLGAASEAARTMRNEFDSLNVAWGSVHTLTRGGREVALPGASTGEPIFTASDFVFQDRKWRVTYGYGFAMVVAFGERPSAVSMTPFGASEDPRSPHYADQLDLMAQGRFKVTRFEPEDVQRSAMAARGRRLFLRARGVEALFTLSAPSSIVARLDAATDPPAELLEDFAPFTLFVSVEKAPRMTPMQTHIDVFVPPVLCARDSLDKLAIYAYDPMRAWVRLESQQLDIEARRFSADDDQGPSTYAVLGPAMYRATRMPIPGENEPEAAKPPMVSPPQPPEESKPAATEEPPAAAPESPAPEQTPAEATAEQPRKKSRVTWGTPPRPKQQRFTMPAEEEQPAVQPPILNAPSSEPQIGAVPPDGFDDEAGMQPDTGKKKDKKHKKEKKPKKSERKVEETRPGSVNRNFGFESSRPADLPKTHAPREKKKRESKPE